MAIAFLLVLIVAVAGSAGLVAAFAWLVQRLNRLESPGQGDVRGRLADPDDLRQQLDALEAEVHRLSERVDFTEKLLEGPRPGRPSSAADTEDTPR